MNLTIYYQLAPRVRISGAVHPFPISFRGVFSETISSCNKKRAQLETDRTQGAEEIFGPKREDVVRVFLKFNSDVLHNLHS